MPVAQSRTVDTRTRATRAAAPKDATMSGTPTAVDASVLAALLDAEDPAHARARRLFETGRALVAIPNEISVLVRRLETAGHARPSIGHALQLLIGLPQFQVQACDAMTIVLEHYRDGWAIDTALLLGQCHGRCRLVTMDAAFAAECQSRKVWTPVVAV